jgi:signal peptidase II
LGLSETARRLLGLGVAALALALDQASKFWAIGLLDGPEHPSIALTPFLALTMSWNRGVAYTMLRSDSDLGRYALIAVALGAVVFLAVWLWRAQGLAKTLALGLLIGGALGNAIDRLVHGAVADFLYFHTPVSLGPLSNYVFNIADAAIFVGVMLLLYDSLVLPASSEATAKD